MSGPQPPKWSIGVGVWYGMPLRIHAAWVPAVLCTFYLNWLRTDLTRETIVDWRSVGILAIWIFSVLCHELAHLWALKRVDGIAEEVVITPWGGLSRFRMLTDSGGEVLIALAGPVVNLVLAWGVCLPVVWSQGELDPLRALHPLDPDPFTSAYVWLSAAKVGLWLNSWLMILNLIPAYPFDGGQIARSLVSFPRVQRLVRNPADLVERLGQLIALILSIIAICTLLSTAPRAGRLVPSWLALSGLAALIFAASRGSHSLSASNDSSDESDQPFGYDFSQGYTSLERTSDTIQSPASGPISKWMEQRRAARSRRQLEIEAEDNRRMDEVLARLHELGLAGLTGEERALLQRVSARYRERKE